MKGQSQFHSFRPAMLLVAAVFAFLLVAATGCGKETEKANALVDEVNGIMAEVEGRRSEADSVLAKGLSQMAAGNVEEEKASLTKAQELINGIIPDIEKARSKTDEAAGLEISYSYGEYLDAKSRSLEAALKFNQIDRDMIALLLTDPGMEKAETNTRVTEMQKAMSEQIAKLNEAEAEAQKIAQEHSGEIGG